MTSALFMLSAFAALVWVVMTSRRVEPDAPRALVFAWQLAALSFVPGPEELTGGTTAIVIAAALVAVAAATVVFHRLRTADWQLHYTGWLALYSVVLLTAMVLSSAPQDSVLRTVRAIVVPVVFVQTAVGIDRRILQRLFGQFMIGAATAVVVGAVLVPDEAFRALRAPVIRVSLTAPALGYGPHWTGLIGLGLIAAVLMNGNDRPAPSLPWQTTLTAGRERLVGGAALGFGIAIVVLPLQRAFWLAGVSAVVTWLLLRRRRQLLPALAAVAVLSTLFLVVGPLRDLWDREQSRPVNNIFSVRAEIFSESIDRFYQRPIIGDGLGVGNRNLLIELGQPDFYWSSHSELGATLAATGLLGLLAVVLGHANGIAGSFRAWRDRQDAIPLMAVAASLTLIPFWRILQEPLLLSLPYYVFVLPSHRWSTVSLRETASSALPKSAQ